MLKFWDSTHSHVYIVLRIFRFASPRTRDADTIVRHMYCLQSCNHLYPIARRQTGKIPDTPANTGRSKFEQSHKKGLAQTCQFRASAHACLKAPPFSAAELEKLASSSQSHFGEEHVSGCLQRRHIRRFGRKPVLCTVFTRVQDAPILPPINASSLKSWGVSTFGCDLFTGGHCPVKHV